MRNGQGLQLAAPIVAVDVSRRDWLDKTAVVLTECGGIYFVRVTDTGYLESTKGGEPLRFRLGISRLTKQLRYWPVGDVEPVLADAIEWREDRAYKVVADFPRDFFLDKIVCGGNKTLKVKLLIIDN